MEVSPAQAMDGSRAHTDGDLVGQPGVASHEASTEIWMEPRESSSPNLRDGQIETPVLNQVNSFMGEVASALKEVVSELKSLGRDNGCGSSNYPQQPIQQFASRRDGLVQDGYVEDGQFFSSERDGPQQMRRPVVPAARGEYDENNSHFPVGYGASRARTNSHAQGRYHDPQGAGQPRHWPEGDRSTGRRVSGHGQPNFKIPPFTGKEDWAVWFAKFEAIARRYGWGEDDKLDNLLPRIEGQASEFVFSQLPLCALDDYGYLVEELTRRYRVVETSRSFAAKFSRRNQRHGETAENYAAELKMLYDKAHKNRERTVRDEDLVRRFLDGLVDQEAKFEVEYHKEPKNIDEAVFHVVNLVQLKSNYRNERQFRQQARRTKEVGQSDSYFEDQSRELNGIYRIPEARAGMQSRHEPKKSAQCDLLTTNQQEELIQHLQRRIEKLEGDRSNKRGQSLASGSVQCYRCQEFGHYAKECPKREQRKTGAGNTNTQKGKCFHCNEVGHYAHECPKRVNTERGSQRVKQEFSGSPLRHNLNFKGPSLEATERSN